MTEMTGPLMFWLALFLPPVDATTIPRGMTVSSFAYQSPAYAPYGLFSMGQPAQQVACVLDIGSSDTLTIDTSGYSGPYYLDRFNPSNALRTTYGSLARVTFTDLPSYDRSLSNDWQYNNESNLSTSFVWNAYETVQGIWINDLISAYNWSGTAVIGLLQSTNTTSCIMGLGPTNGEIAGETFEIRTVTPSYPNLLELYANGGVMATKSYSMWFNSAQGLGAILFGGTDRNKYLGNLTIVPIVSYVSSGDQVSHIPGTVLSTRIMFHGLSVYYLESTSGANTAALATTTNTSTPSVVSSDTLTNLTNSSSSNLASNSTSSPQKLHLNLALQAETSITVDLSTLELFSRLPYEMVSGAFELLGLTFIPDLGVYGCACNAQGMLSLNMSGFFMNMNLSDVLVPANNLGISQWTMSDGSDLCLVTIIPDDSYSYVIGNGILRNIYTMVDLSLNLVAFAPLNRSCDPSDTQYETYEYNDRYKSMNTADGYTCTSLSREVAATFYATTPVANSLVSVVPNGGYQLIPHFASFFYLFLYFI